MKGVMNDFDSRVKEINIYFAFIEEVTTHNAQLYFPVKINRKYKTIDSELTKMLKANGFLLLYNLVESSIKKSIEEIYNSLSKENVPYKKVTDEIKKKWIEEKYKNFKDQDYVAEKIFNAIKIIEDDIITLTFNSKRFFKGNIDSKKIRNISRLYGFSSKAHYSTKDGEKLFLVKNRRNDLAHGLVSFCDCGKDYSIEQMLEIKKQVVSYLRSILKNVHLFILDKKYLISA